MKALCNMLCFAAEIVLALAAVLWLSAVVVESQRILREGGAHSFVEALRAASRTPVL